MASMDHMDAARARLHSLFNASFEKLDDALSNASTTVSHKAHCYRVDIHLLSVLSIIGTNEGPAVNNFVEDCVGDTDSSPRLDIFHKLNTRLKHWQVTGVDKLIWLAKSPFKGGFLCDAMGLGESTQALVAAIQVKKTMPTRSGFIAIVTRAGCVLQWVDEIKRHLKPEHHTPYSFLDDPGIDKNCRLQYNIVVSSCNFCMAKYQDLVNFAVFCHAIASYGVDETRKIHYDAIRRNVVVIILYDTHKKALLYSNNDDLQPEEPEDDLFTRPYQGLIVARPKSMVRLKAKKVEHVFEFIDRVAVLVTGQMVACARKYLRRQEAISDERKQEPCSLTLWVRYWLTLLAEARRPRARL
ncbi:uncharacterized protein FRV6_03458 [Fusarium oxysporum]|uniref:SNF2 N-terminal domain-containing protein n=1 Tax=Fusarium oxysporum TaxID=5507 RepID=A0A2H3T0M9_FUSOX|nr:uncharacterized protein FRV6_03458 [Fusarium oxysporum]